jgi:hypothetical protein
VLNHDNIQVLHHRRQVLDYRLQKEHIPKLSSSFLFSRHFSTFSTSPPSSSTFTTTTKMEDDSYSSYFAAQYPQSTIANPSNAAPQYRQQHAMQGLAYNPNFAAQYRQRNISHPGNSAIQYRQQTNAQAHQHRNPAPQDYLPYQMLYPPNLAPQNNQQYNLQEYMPAPQSYQQGVIQGPYPQPNTINPTRVELATSQYTQHQHQFTEQHMRLAQPSRPDEGRPHDHRVGAFSNHPSPPRLGNAMGAQYPHMPTMQMELPPHQQRVPQDTARPQYVPLLAFSRPGYPPQHYSKSKSTLSKLASHSLILHQVTQLLWHPLVRTRTKFDLRTS